MEQVVTLEDVRALYPCYDPAKYGLQQATIGQILNLEECPIADRIWLVMRVIPLKHRADFNAWCAARQFNYAVALQRVYDINLAKNKARAAAGTNPEEDARTVARCVAEAGRLAEQRARLRYLLNQAKG